MPFHTTAQTQHEDYFDDDTIEPRNSLYKIKLWITSFVIVRYQIPFHKWKQALCYSFYICHSVKVFNTMIYVGIDQTCTVVHIEIPTNHHKSIILTSYRKVNTYRTWSNWMQDMIKTHSWLILSWTVNFVLWTGLPKWTCGVGSPACGNSFLCK